MNNIKNSRWSVSGPASEEKVGSWVIGAVRDCASRILCSPENNELTVEADELAIIGPAQAPKILVIDDSAFSRKLVDCALRHRGYDVALKLSRA